MDTAFSLVSPVGTEMSVSRKLREDTSSWVSYYTVEGSVVGKGMGMGMASGCIADS